MIFGERTYTSSFDKDQFDDSASLNRSQRPEFEQAHKNKRKISNEASFGSCEINPSKYPAFIHDEVENQATNKMIAYESQFNNEIPSVVAQELKKFENAQIVPPHENRGKKAINV